MSTIYSEIPDSDLMAKSENQPSPTVRQEKQNRLPTRYVIASMAFLSSVFAYNVRANFTLNLLAMVEIHNGTSVVEQPDYGPRTNWSPYEQGLLLGAFSYAYPLSSLLCGLLLQRYSIGRELIAVGFLLTAALYAIAPLASRTQHSFAALFAIRFLMGAAQGGAFVNVHRVMTRWAPRSELGLFSFAISGSNVGVMLTLATSGPIIEAFGWRWSFYCTAVQVLVFVAAWWRLVYDAPDLHPRIAAEERRYIDANLPTSTGQSNEWPPIGRMFASLPFWAFVGSQFASDFGLYFVVNGVPIFLNQVLGFKVSSTGFLAALPYAVRTSVGFLVGYYGDRLRTRNYVSLTNFRKLFCIISHIMPGVILLIIPFAGANQPYVCVALMVVSFGLNGAITQTSLVNNHDLSPTLATSTNAISNFVASCSGFISPLVVAYFTSEQNTIAEWRYIFVTGATVYIVPALFFMLVGSGEDQKWNETRPKGIKLLNANNPERTTSSYGIHWT